MLLGLVIDRVLVDSEEGQLEKGSCITIELQVPLGAVGFLFQVRK